VLNLTMAYIMYVRHSLKILFCLSVSLVLDRSAEAITSDAPIGQYQTIPERNVFGLRPPQQQEVAQSREAPLPKITLTGITTILENKRALMKVAAPGVKPGEVNKELSLILTEGQREGEIEVLQIDEKAGSVKVNNSGTIMLLTFEKDGAKLPPTAPALPVTARGVATAPPLPGAPPAVAGVPTNAYTLPARGSGRNARLPAAARAAAYGSTTVGAPPVAVVPGPTGVTLSAAPVQAAGQQDVTAEEQAIIAEVQRQVNATNPSVPSPTGLTPSEAQSPQPVYQQPVAPVPGVSGYIPGKPTGLVPQ
jgi:hypothetical protein